MEINKTTASTIWNGILLLKTFITLSILAYAKAAVDISEPNLLPNKSAKFAATAYLATPNLALKYLPESLT